MRTFWEDDISRRALLRLGLAGAVVAAAPWPFGRAARATTTSPHFLVTLIGDGGWDPTQVLDVHDPADTTDGIDVDVPGQPPSVIANAGGITYVSNPVTRPSVDAYFATWAGQTAIVNGINTRSTSHDQSRQLVLTGYLDPTRADFAVMAAHYNGPDLPLPHLLISGDSFGGPFAGISGRTGGQFSQVVGYNRLPNGAGSAVSTAGEGYIKQTLQALGAADATTAVAGRVDQFTDANVRGDRLAGLASSLPRNTNDGTQLATSLGAAFRAGMTTSVTVSNVGGFDTHSNNENQAGQWDDVFSFLNAFLAGLAAQPGVAAPTLLEETTIVYCSEFGRTPQLNGDNGKDHHPWTSMIMAGKGVRGGTTVGLTDGSQEGVKTNFATGLPDDTGMVIDVTNMVAGILTLVGANSNDYLNGVKPFTAMIA